jgi:predicted AAA+ superfamily ATPase
MWIERDWSPALTQLTRSFSAVLLTGPRQVGKTSLLRHLYPNATYVTFDDPALAQQAESQPEIFLDSHREPLILDEVQYVPTLFRALKRRIDRNREAGRFLLTGSQTFPLMQNVSESLAGRIGILEMSSLSLHEVQLAQGPCSDLSFLLTGGFPILHTDHALDPQTFYPSYIASYLERDVRNMKNVGNLRDFDRFLRATALRTGQLLSYSDLARDVGIAPNTARAWISVLEASGQIYLLEPYHRSLGKRLVKSPKLYFLDTGLVCSLIGIRTMEGLLSSPAAGALWETFVVGQVIRHFQSRGTNPPLWFWRTQSGDEVDLLIESGSRFTVIECKLTEAPTNRDAKGIARLADFYGHSSVSKAFVACRTSRSHLIDTKIKAEASGVLALLEKLG